MRILLWALLLVLAAGTGTFAEKYTVPPADSSETVEFHDPFAEPESEQIKDPLETLNRAFFRFNDLVYTRILVPACRAVPPELQEKLAATLAAFEQPLRIGGFELKFAFRDGGSEAGRFVMHAVLDLLHHVDPATTQGLQNGEEDFGKTLQALGFDSGIYLVLPVLGPSSLRDGIGRITSFYLDPSPRLCNPDGRREIPTDASLAGMLRAYEEICRQTLDPYLFLRDAYAQQLASEERKIHLSQASPPSFSRVPNKTGRHNAAFL